MHIKIFLVVGARPNFMKIAPIYSEMKKDSNKFDPIIVHTGQHYDEKMSKVFFEELELPKPHIYLGVGSGSHAQQTAEIMKQFEAQLLKHQPHVMMVVGDVNSTIACCLTTSKIRYSLPEFDQLWNKYEQFISNRKTKVLVTDFHKKRRRSYSTPIIAHVEAGLRSFDFDMPEEVNRIETDILSDILFTTCEDGDNNLIAEGTDPRKVFFVGNVMIDSLKTFIEKAKKSEIIKALNKKSNHDRNGFIKENQFVLVTLHRPSNVDNQEMLSMILSALMDVSDEFPILFPMHPRTQKLMKELPNDFINTIDNNKVIITDPIGYLDFLNLQMNAKLVLTDSGGIQEETSYLGIPCLTLRPNTERPITIEQGTNQLVKMTKNSIVQVAKESLSNNDVNPSNIQYWDGNSAKRIVDVLVSVFDLKNN